MGQDTLYYYSSSKINPDCGFSENWCISNSFIGLVLHLRKTGRSLSLYTPALSSFFLNEGTRHGAQLLSHQTAVREIKVLPIGWELIGSKLTRRLRVGKYLWPIRKEKECDHREGIEQYLFTTVGRIRALASIPNARIFCDLSGGRELSHRNWHSREIWDCTRFDIFKLKYSVGTRLPGCRKGVCIPGL